MLQDFSITNFYYFQPFGSLTKLKVTISKTKEFFFLLIAIAIKYYKLLGVKKVKLWEIILY